LADVRETLSVMPGPGPGIHELIFGDVFKSWMAGTSPAMTRFDRVAFALSAA
jgi:hypothetical protein